MSRQLAPGRGCNTEKMRQPGSLLTAETQDQLESILPSRLEPTAVHLLMSDVEVVRPVREGRVAAAVPVLIPLSDVERRAMLLPGACLERGLQRPDMRSVVHGTGVRQLGGLVHVQIGPAFLDGTEIPLHRLGIHLDLIGELVERLALLPSRLMEMKESGTSVKSFLNSWPTLSLPLSMRKFQITRGFSSLRVAHTVTSVPTRPSVLRMRTVALPVFAGAVVTKVRPLVPTSVPSSQVGPSMRGPMVAQPPFALLFQNPIIRSTILIGFLPTAAAAQAMNWNGPLTGAAQPSERACRSYSSQRSSITFSSLHPAASTSGNVIASPSTTVRQARHHANTNES